MTTFPSLIIRCFQTYRIQAIYDMTLPFFKRQILDSCKLKDIADDNFKHDENGRKVFKQVENTVGKREIARYQQFLLFPQCFQKACFPGASKGVVVWEWIKCASFTTIRR